MDNPTTDTIYTHAPDTCTIRNGALSWEALVVIAQPLCHLASCTAHLSTASYSSGPCNVPVSTSHKHWHCSGNRHYSAYCQYSLLPSVPQYFTGPIAGKWHYSTGAVEGPLMYYIYNHPPPAGNFERGYDSKIRTKPPLMTKIHKKTRFDHRGKSTKLWQSSEAKTVS